MLVYCQVAFFPVTVSQSVPFALRSRIRVRVLGRVLPSLLLSFQVLVPEMLVAWVLVTVVWVLLSVLGLHYA